MSHLLGKHVSLSECITTATTSTAITTLNNNDKTITYCTLTMNLALKRHDLTLLHSIDARLETQRGEITCPGFHSLE